MRFDPGIIEKNDFFKNTIRSKCVLPLENKEKFTGHTIEPNGEGAPRKIEKAQNCHTTKGLHYLSPAVHGAAR
jgi:hypothetical protein